MAACSIIPVPSILAWKIPDRGAPWTSVHRVTRSQTQLSRAHTHFRILFSLPVMHDLNYFHFGYQDAQK